MKNFKIKNRRKRKYVKKNNLTSSLSLTHSLTLGILPAVLIAIPFIAMYLIYKFPIISLQIPLALPSTPTITLPEIRFELSLASIPQMPDANYTFNTASQAFCSEAGAVGANSIMIIKQ